MVYDFLVAVKWMRFRLVASSNSPPPETVISRSLNQLLTDVKQLSLIPR